MDEKDFRSAAMALAALDHLGVPELEILYKLERTAAQLYERMADRIGDDEAAELVRRNAREELGHASRVRRALTLKTGGPFQPTLDMDEGYPVEAPAVVDAALLAAVVEGERAGDADYQRWADAEPDPEVARLLRISGREESGHADRFTRAIARLGAGR
ncbi:ferritin-like domain-containing protein [Frankia sp. CNm7]|uniref:Ferritin-like domain-containing protein n=1 Tax=Frankia nepalensis TaxID=1836974 RepID=A0A937RMW6_9ACTN|nr:ferritin-like domain-containing protein [Frankia nepalensis]MBL7497387.1 ferritin-like domain-containing protein [Frankia nepalensis]MBL7512090.1 ferritin-like domain-containing protein [Frankia nepalensis]MBL7523256.1 ferritin-like domain-containing protein [Frankia nepalensis]MBL7631810.1 ferritin-like domain-containing protein [Frankia nepalensis]